MTSIRIFSQPTCPACNELKDYLKKKGVNFEDMDVTSNREALDEMIKVHKVRVTPLLLAGDKKIIGFDPVEVDKVLAELQ
ncbi:MAG TPA: glutaredoxin domain-containing protein [Methanocella sp.]|jgi:glutaredoxin-like YruB-family protein